MLQSTHEVWMADVRETADTHETSQLISSDKVEGTSVVNPQGDDLGHQGDDLGHIEEVMIDKVSGQVAYAVLKYGSFLGMGGKLFALPWDQLKYDTSHGALEIPKRARSPAPMGRNASRRLSVGGHWPEGGPARAR
jgi:hypothetical protein